MHRVDARAGKCVHDRAHQRVIGRGRAPGGIGGAALFGEGWLALGGRQGDGPARAGRLGQQRGEPRRQVARRLRLVAAARSPAGRSAPDAPSGPDARAASPRAARPPGRRRRGSSPACGVAAGAAAAETGPPRRRQHEHRRRTVQRLRRQRPVAMSPPPEVSRRTSSPGGGRSATWHSRISTISAAARRSGAGSTSPTPFSSICQARPEGRHREPVGQLRAAGALGLRQFGAVTQGRAPISGASRCGPAPADPAA